MTIKVVKKMRDKNKTTEDDSFRREENIIIKWPWFSRSRLFIRE